MHVYNVHVQQNQGKLIRINIATLLCSHIYIWKAYIYIHVDCNIVCAPT